MIKNFNHLLEEAKKKKGIITGVPSPHDDSSVKTIVNAHKRGISDFILTGNIDKIISLIENNGGNRNDFTILASNSDEEAALKIVDLANEGKIQVILKGFLSTAKLMKPVLDKNRGLRTGKLLTDIMITENPIEGNEGIIGLSDGGLVILPDLDQKRQIIENSVFVFHRLGFKNPYVGIMTAVESVKDSIPSTTDAAALTEMNINGEIKGCRVYGPLALDIAVSKEAAEHKNIKDPVAGNVDILIMPNIESGNLLGKSFTYYLNQTVAHVVIGARIPVLIPSRNESDVDKLHSVALGVIIA